MKIILGVLFLAFIIGGYFVYDIVRGDILNKKDLRWQPYKVGDELIFESNFGQIDKIIVTEIYKSKPPAINFSIIPKEVIDVRIQRKRIELPKVNDDSYNKYDYNGKGVHNTANTLLTLDANVYFGGKEYEKSLEYWVPLGVEKKKIKHLNAISKNDIEIKIEEKGKYFTTYEILNKKYGIISYGYEHKNWELKKFLRNGKNIYKPTMANTVYK
ncbi:hypothetical protein OAC51_07830 [Flavobacteriaceae bacterium]|nr:hypothetical protein [Flavobacteriaceae bacterium]